MTLRDIAPEIARLIVEYNSEDCTDERREQIESEIEALDVALEVKAESYANLIEHYESEGSRYKAEEQRLASIRKRHERSAEWLKKNLEANLLTIGKRDLKTDYHDFKFRRSESLVVRAEDELPEEYMIDVPATKTPDNAKIKQALKDRCELPKDYFGEYESPEVPGAVLLIKQNLQIK